MNMRERLDSLSRGELAGLVVVIVLLLGAVGFWYTRSLPRPIDIATDAAPMAAAPAVPSASVAVFPAASTSTLIVDVTGWVRKPGVFAFEPGDRVIDAVERAGGARDNADLTLLNLAAPLVDGQQILVPKEGAQAPGTVPGTTPGTTGVPGATGGLININTADEATLETLNGVGPVLGASIIAYRTEHGPFTSIDQLDEVSGIGPATMEDLRSQVTV
jgi:competence protein ComEA